MNTYYNRHLFDEHLLQQTPVWWTPITTDTCLMNTYYNRHLFDEHLLQQTPVWWIPITTDTCLMNTYYNRHLFDEHLLQQTSLQFTLLSLKRICILQLTITSKIYGMVSTKCKWISRCIHYKNNSTRWHQYDSFSIQHSNGHRHKTPAIARCFTFYTTVSPLRRKYMEERRERVIRLSSDSTSFLQNCMVDYFGELWCR